MHKDIYLKKEGHPNQIANLIFSFSWAGEERQTYPFGFANHSDKGEKKSSISREGLELGKKETSTPDFGVITFPTTTTISTTTNNNSNSEQTKQSESTTATTSASSSAGKEHLLSKQQQIISSNSIEIPTQGLTQETSEIPNFENLDRQVSDFIRSNALNGSNSFSSMTNNFNDSISSPIPTNNTIIRSSEDIQIPTQLTRNETLFVNTLAEVFTLMSSSFQT